MNVRLLPLVLSLVTTALHAENWSNWRGPLHNGSSPEKNLPASFSKTEGVKWSVEMPGASAATPAPSDFIRDLVAQDVSATWSVVGGIVVRHAGNVCVSRAPRVRGRILRPTCRARCVP